MTGILPFWPYDKAERFPRLALFTTMITKESLTLIGIRMLSVVGPLVYRCSADGVLYIS